MEADPALVWFRDGLPFECTRCGDCCTGEPGNVWLNDEEVTRLAAMVGETTEEFERKYVRRVGKQRSLRERGDGSCVFFQPKHGCMVYAERPRQCRTWPFWDSNLKSPETWEETCRICPGSGSGPLISAEEILKRSELIRI